MGRHLRLRRHASTTSDLVEAPPPEPGEDPVLRHSVFAVVATSSGTSLLTRKDSLVAFAHAMEEECEGGLDRAHVFGGFQRTAFYAPARERWERLAGEARSAHVFADAGRGRGWRPGTPVEVHLDAGCPIGREWLVVVDRPGGAMALTARERPGQELVSDAERLFDSAWTTDALVVRRAARACALVAVGVGVPGAGSLALDLALPPAPAPADPTLRERLLDRLLELIDPMAEP